MENVDNPDQSRADDSARDAGRDIAGLHLRAAREAQGLSRADVAARTKIAERHLLSIEESRFGDLAARTYAVGFARSYARAVGLDEGVIAQQVRRQLDAEADVRPVTVPSFEPGDPARVPSRRLAWVAAIGVIVVIGLLLVFWSSYLRPEGTLPDLTSDATPTATAPASRSAAPSAPAPVPVDGPVVLSAPVGQVWIKVTDASGAQVVQKELKQGETWTAPAGVAGLQLRTGRPDALQIVVGGKAIPRLSDKPQLMSGISLNGRDLLVRLTPATPSAGTAVTPPMSRPSLRSPLAAPGPATVSADDPTAVASVPQPGATPSPLSTETH